MLKITKGLAYALIFMCIFTMHGHTQDYSRYYDPKFLQKEAPRLKKAISKLYRLLYFRFFNPQEKRAFAKVQFQFPYPKPNDYLLNFYAGFDRNSNPIVIMPLLSLKALEDLATAYAWLQVNGYSLSTIDLYFTMLRHRNKRDFENGQPPNILQALNIPDKALKDKRVDDLSLRLRNEAFAFILAHELGHIYFQHKGYNEITPKQAREDEVQSDNFALDIMTRSSTPVLGAILFFQAQIYSLPHRGEFRSHDEWQKFLHTQATHPLSIKRIDAMISYIENSLADRRSGEKPIWLSIALQLKQLANIMEETDLHKCMVQVAKKAPLSILKPRKKIAKWTMEKYCKKI